VADGPIFKKKDFNYQLKAVFIFLIYTSHKGEKRHFSLFLNLHVLSSPVTQPNPTQPTACSFGWWLMADAGLF
jgi:hypothetical protein